MSYRGLTFDLKPTPEQSTALSRFGGVTRLVWNLALEQRNNHWRKYQEQTGNNLNYFGQAKELTELRRQFDFIAAVPVTPLQKTIQALDAAFKNAWRGLAGYPSFKRKGNIDSFSFAGREVKVQKINKRWARIYLPKVGWTKFRQTRQLLGDIRVVTISRHSDEWRVSIICQRPLDQPKPNSSIGIDYGVSVPLFLSNGKTYKLPDSIAVLEGLYINACKDLSRKKAGSYRHRQVRARISKLKARQSRIRKDWAHKTTTEITQQHGTVVIERLRTKKMTRRTGRPAKTRLNRSILNVGWQQISQMLAYKADNLIKVDPAYTSQTCSSCGTVDKRSRKSQAIFECTSCGFEINADLNAAINVLHRGSAPGAEAPYSGAAETRTTEKNPH